MKRLKDQADRNRRNALCSTGPKSLEGKDRSSMNAISHGLRSGRSVIPGEAVQEWEDFENGVASDLNASSQTERALSFHVASALWRLARGARYEAETVTWSMSRDELEKDYDEHVRQAHYLMRDDFVNSNVVRKAKAVLEEGLAYLSWYKDTYKFCQMFPNLDPECEILEDFPEELGAMVQAPPEAVEAILNRGTPPRVQDIQDLFAMGKVSLEDLTQVLKDRLDKRRKSVETQRKTFESVEASYKASLATFAATRVILQTDELARLQTYEAHLHRNLQRSLESLKLFREIKSSPDIKVSGKVASFVKNTEES
jgi:hypothetical protein